MKYKGRVFDDQQIIEKYRELNNVWKVGDYFGISGQSVHAFLSRVGAINKINVFSAEEIETLKSNYNSYAKRHKLKLLADEMGRSLASISKKAKELGLRDKHRKAELEADKHEFYSKIAIERIKKYGHPRGMLGKKHTAEHKLRQSERSKDLWREHPEIFINEEHLRKMSDRMSNMQLNGKLGIRSRTYMTRLKIGGKDIVLKSNWEFNIALLLEYKKQIGEIEDWDYESVVFKFGYNKLGVRSYRPDFTVLKNSKQTYLEVKGWYDDKTQKKESLMKECYPEINIVLLGEKRYFELEKEYKEIIMCWDYRKTIKNNFVCINIETEKFIDKEKPRVEFKIVTLE